MPLIQDPTFTEPLPAALRTRYDALTASLDDLIPTKQLDENLLIGTWNIRAFGGLVDRWLSTQDDSPKRDRFGLLTIAEIVSRFDVVALQEVKGNLRALRHMLKMLGPDWGLICTDIAGRAGLEGNDERIAFVFDTRRVRPSGLAAELVIPSDRPIDEGALQRQFARTPYAVSFLSAGRTFILVALHVLWGEGPADRVDELREIALWLSNMASDVNRWDHNVIGLGDFNIDRIHDPLYQAFTSTGLRVPQELHQVPRTLFGSNLDKHYDQIAWFTEPGGAPVLSLRYTGRAGGINFTELAHPGLTLNQLSWRVSDHYPLWVEFAIEEEP